MGPEFRFLSFDELILARPTFNPFDIAGPEIIGLLGLIFQRKLKILNEDGSEIMSSEQYVTQDEAAKMQEYPEITLLRHEYRSVYSENTDGDIPDGTITYSLLVASDNDLE